MKLKAGEKILHQEAISEEAFAEIQKNHEEIEDAERQVHTLQARIEMLTAKASYLNKRKWVVIDTEHPKTNLELYTPAKGSNVCRRIDMETRTVAVIEGCRDHGHGPLGGIGELREIHVHSGDGLPDFLKEILLEAAAKSRPNNPKKPDPDPAPTGAGSSERPSNEQAAAAETAEAAST